ncbi:MAG: IPT/TIG domain-containing protein [Verrucomicrobiales bacterium]|nr:IPT/TIG domain-containing protein [Verrucomicrobiales bacterium]
MVPPLMFVSRRWQWLVGVALAWIGTVLGAPGATITSFTPDRGPAGTEVTIFGAGLQTASQVLFGAMDAPGDILSRSANSVRARVPQNALTGPISIFTGSGAASSLAIFIAAPRITEFTPLTGGPRTLVTISGANFGTGAGRGNVTAVWFNGQPASYQVTAINQLMAMVPTNATSGPITVINEAGAGTTLLSFQVPAVITGFSPTNGMPGDPIEVRGYNLSNPLRVEFGIIPAAYSSLSPTNFIAFVPTNAVNGRIAVTTSAGVTSTTSNFVVTPRIIRFSPAFGPVGTSVTLEGGGLSGVTEVRFDGTIATFTATPPMSVVAKVPSGAATGPIKVVTPAGSFTTTSNFFLPANVTSFTPTAGKRGDVITINGDNVGDALRVLFNGAETPFTVVNANRLTAAVPGPATTGVISVETPAGTHPSTATFSVRPVLDGFSPINAAVGSPVQLYGSGLTNLSWVRLGDLDATFTVINSTNVRTLVPLGAFSAPFKVRTSAGTEVESAGTFFVDGAKPTLDLLTPANGPVGTKVILNGTGLRSASKVEFNGTTATFSVASATRIDTTVPAGAVTGPVAITTLDGIAISTTPFVVGTLTIALQIEKQGQVINLRWPAAAVGYVLEQSSALGTAATWSTVDSTPVAEGTSLRVSLALPTTGARYFRLKK